MPTLDITLAAANDNAHENEDSSTFTINSGSGIFIRQRTSPLSLRFSGGFRFVVPDIASGDTIDVAYLTFNNINSAVDDLTATAYFEDVDNAADFATTGNVISRTRTTASVAVSNLSVGQDADFNTASLVGPLQEVIDRGGWSAGNAVMALFITGSGTNNCRPKSYANSTSLCARLHIEYTAAAGGGSLIYPQWNPLSNFLVR